MAEGQEAMSILKRTVGVVIPARGGSKGVPNKNLQEVGGQPLVHYPIMIASMIMADEVVVTSDSDEILKAADKLRLAKLIKRSDELSGDDVVLDPVIVDAATQMGTEIIITLLPTCPFLRPSKLKEGLLKFKQAPVVAAVSCHEVVWHLWNNSKKLVMENISGPRANRQKARKIFIESGAFSICSRSHLIVYGTRYYEKPELLPISAGDAFDIDTIDDLQFARRFFRGV